jgi:hypothetical protein
MAITATAAYGPNVTLPTGYTNPTLTPISSPVQGTYQVDTLATAANADPTIGAANVLAALETQFEGTYAISTLNMDATLTVTANLTVTSINRINDGDDTSKFKSGTEQYRCVIAYDFT